MSDLPKLSIVMVSYKRTEMALRTLRSTSQNLIYPKELRGFYLGDDGSNQKDFLKLLECLGENQENVLGYHNERLRKPEHKDTFFAGLGWNKALGIAYQNSDFVLFLEDDWELEQPFDIVPYVKLLQENERVGIVSFRILSVGNDVHTVGHGGQVYLKYLRTTQYSYSGNPHLRHARFVRYYGWFDETVNPGGIELKQDDKYRLDVEDGPEIWRPVTVDPWGAWHHIGQEKSWK